MPGSIRERSTARCALIRKIAERGITILIIEHLMKVVLSLAERVLVLHHGELIAEGSARRDRGATRVIEAYLGEKFARRVAAESRQWLSRCWPSRG